MKVYDVKSYVVRAVYIDSDDAMRRTLTLHRLGLTNQSNRREIILSKVNALEVKEHS